MIVLGPEEHVRTWLDSGEDSSDSGKRYRGYCVDGGVSGRQGWVWDVQSQLNLDPVDAVGRLDGAWWPCSCAVRDQGVPSGLPEAAEVRLGIGGTGLWWESDTVVCH